MKRCIPILVTCALFAAQPTFASPTFAGANDTDKTEKADKADKDKSDKDKDKAEKDKADKDKSAKSDKDKADKADKADKGDKAASGAAANGQAAANGDAANATGAAAGAQDQRDDAVLDVSQPDFTIVNLPTTLRMPKFKSAFRFTHRFTRALGDGDFGDLAGDLFGLDSSAFIGLEYRFGVWDGLQAGIHRTNDNKTIDFFSQYDVRSQTASWPVGISAYVSIEGTNNFRDSYSPALGVVLSRTFTRYGAAYVMPIWVNNTNPLPSEVSEDNSTFLLGVGTRLRVHGSTYFVAEVVPRVSGYDPGVTSASFAIEKRVGGHAFQLNFSNSFGTTMAQIARGGFRNADDDQNWYLGFNISRKFF